MAKPKQETKKVRQGVNVHGISKLWICDKFDYPLTSINVGVKNKKGDGYVNERLRVYITQEALNASCVVPENGDTIEYEGFLSVDYWTKEQQIKTRLKIVITGFEVLNG